MIIDRENGEVVARPFDKFFNWEEDGRSTNANIEVVMEKLDGSLGVLYRDNGYKIATKGSFTSPQAQWATQFLNENYALTDLPNQFTLLFEIIIPENRVVVDYGRRTDLILLAARNRFSGIYLSFNELLDQAQKYGLSLPKLYKFDNIEEVIKNKDTLGLKAEGWVVTFTDGTRYKVKGTEYYRAKLLSSNLHITDVLISLEQETIDQFLNITPDQYLKKAKAWIFEIQTTTETIKKKFTEFLNQHLRWIKSSFLLGSI